MVMHVLTRRYVIRIVALLYQSRLVTPHYR